jgi:hypothetical protein
MQTTAIQDFGQCPWCGLIHQGECPRVKSKSFYPDGTLERIEFHDPDRSLAMSPDTLRHLALADDDVNCDPRELSTDDYNWMFGTGRYYQ